MWRSTADSVHQPRIGRVRNADAAAHASDAADVSPTLRRGRVILLSRPPIRLVAPIRLERVKIARFSTGGDPRFGIVDDDELVVLAGDPMFAGYDTTGERVPLSEARLLAPVIPRSKVICMLGNVGDGSGVDAPRMLLKPNTAVIGPGDTIPLPDVGAIHHEGELVAVIGRITRRVPVESAADHVFGYTIGNDLTAVDPRDAGDWIGAKARDGFAPIGPMIETELDPTSVTVSVQVNGSDVADGSTSQLRRSVAEVVAAASEVFTLLPGDLMFLGAVAGSGEVRDGDTVAITIDGIGTLSNPARAQ